MSNGLRAFLTLLAVICVIALGLFWPAGNYAKEDGYRPDLVTPTMTAFTDNNPDFTLSNVTRLQKIESSTDELRAGGFKYRPQDLVWTFTVPVDWGKRADALEVRRVIERLTLVDPFLRSYEKTGNADDFRQAVFFFTDWQSFYQTGQKYTDHTWDVDAVEGRMSRLAFILSEINRVPGLLPDNETLRLIKLADFHIQRASDPVYGAQQNLSVDTSAFKAVCRVLARLTSCETVMK